MHTRININDFRLCSSAARSQTYPHVQVRGSGGGKKKNKNQPAVLTCHEINTSLFTNNNNNKKNPLKRRISASRRSRVSGFTTNACVRYGCRRERRLIRLLLYWLLYWRLLLSLLMNNHRCLPTAAACRGPVGARLHCRSRITACWPPSSVILSPSQQESTQPITFSTLC